MMPLGLVVAVDRESGIGKAGEVPWWVPADLRHFKRITTDTRREGARNAVIMGRKTWQSIPARFQPLSGRFNIVLSRNPDLDVPAGVALVHDFERAVQVAAQADDIESVFAIGGHRIYALAMAHPACRDLYITRIDGAFACDTRFPDIPADYRRGDDLGHGTSGDLEYRIEHWRRTDPVATSRPAGET